MIFAEPPKSSLFYICPSLLAPPTHLHTIIFPGDIHEDKITPGSILYVGPECIQRVSLTLL